MRSASCSDGISSEKKATFFPAFAAAWVATLSAKAVLPTDGRAASTTSCPGWSPRVFLSSVWNPVGTPVMGDCAGLDPLLDRLELLERLPDGLLDGPERLGADALRRGEDLLLRRLEEALHVRAGLVPALHERLRDEHHVAQAGEVLHRRARSAPTFAVGADRALEREAAARAGPRRRGAPSRRAAAAPSPGRGSSPPSRARRTPRTRAGARAGRSRAAGASPRPGRRRCRPRGSRRAPPAPTRGCGAGRARCGAASGGVGAADGIVLRHGRAH